MSQIVYIAYRDRDDRMIPASRDGALLVFDSEEAAKRHRGPLGVVAPVSTERLAGICEQYKLTLAFVTHLTGGQEHVTMRKDNH